MFSIVNYCQYNTCCHDQVNNIGNYCKLMSAFYLGFPDFYHMLFFCLRLSLRMAHPIWAHFLGLRIFRPSYLHLKFIHLLESQIQRYLPSAGFLVFDHLRSRRVLIGYILKNSFNFDMYHDTTTINTEITNFWKNDHRSKVPFWRQRFRKRKNTELQFHFRQVISGVHNRHMNQLC